MNSKVDDYVVWRHWIWKVTRIILREESWPSGLLDVANLEYVCAVDGIRDPPERVKKVRAWITDLSEPPAMLILALVASE